jgi:5-methylcytosine-specific restriction protein B
MTGLRIDQFADACGHLPGNMDFVYRGTAPSIEFSNTGRRGKKYFSITLRALLQTLYDIRKNLPRFTAHMTYDETTWRSLLSDHLTDNAVNALSTVQTLPLFAVIGKTIHIANQLGQNYEQHHVELSQANLDGAIGYLHSQLPDDSAYLDSLGGTSQIVEEVGITYTISPLPDLPAENKIYYGAPGTGKSHAIDTSTVEVYRVGTVFHPDTQYSDFVGCLRPSMANGDIVYSFRPGPFCLALALASANPDEHCCLSIEEINRASAAAVFGEIFQLLDRTPSGESRYSIDISDPDMKEYLVEKAPVAIVDGKLKIPSNLSILATMNSSDQAVMPMDTAFKRRWKFEYIALDFNQCPHGVLSFTAQKKAMSLSWKDFAQIINEELANADIPEDRLLGPWFLDSGELKDATAAKGALSGKLFMYLWDDVLRHDDRSRIFDKSIRNYGELVKKFEIDGKVFCDALEERLLEAASSELAEGSSPVVSAEAEIPSVPDSSLDAS